MNCKIIQTQIETQFSKLVMHSLQIYVYVFKQHRARTSVSHCFLPSKLLKPLHQQTTYRLTGLIDCLRRLVSLQFFLRFLEQFQRIGSHWSFIKLDVASRKRSIDMHNTCYLMLRSPQISCTWKIGWIPRCVLKCLLDGFYQTKPGFVVRKRTNLVDANSKLQWPPISKW